MKDTTKKFDKVLNASKYFNNVDHQPDANKDVIKNGPDRSMPYANQIGNYQRNKPVLTRSYDNSKIYIIDNKIAYLGSLNFTHYGTKSNHETSIRITDRNALLYINSEFESLLVNDYYQERDLIEWGRSLYDEPIN